MTHRVLLHSLEPTFVSFFFPETKRCLRTIQGYFMNLTAVLSVFGLASMDHEPPREGFTAFSFLKGREVPQKSSVPKTVAGCVC